MMRRKVEAVLGAALMAAGGFGLHQTGPWAAASPATPRMEGHETMPRMMGPRGAGTAEQMTSRCPEMMHARGPWVAR